MQERTAEVRVGVSLIYLAIRLGQAVVPCVKPSCRVQSFCGLCLGQLPESLH